MKKSTSKEITGAELARLSADDRKKYFDEARNGTLFIDEAYQLDPKNNAGGADAMHDLLKISEEWRKDTVIILAGYREDMQKLIEFNDGLQSRFPVEFQFEDYNETELRQILIKEIKDKMLLVEDLSMLDVISKRLAKAAGKRGFGNARTVRVVIERSMGAKNQRIATLKENNINIDNKEMFVLSMEDILGLEDLPANSKVLEQLD